MRLVLYGDTILHPEHIFHLVHLAPLVFIHAVNVGAHCERHRVVAEDCGKRFIIHAAFQCAGGEGVAQGVEGKVPDVGILQQAVVVILEGFLLKVVTELVGDDEAIVGVLIPCPNLILRLLLFPAGKLVCHCAGQRNRAAGVFRFGCAEYDFGFVLTVVGFVLGKTVDGTAYMKLRGGKVNIFPFQCEQLPHALCKVLACKTFIIASVFNSYKATPHNSRLTA